MGLGKGQHAVLPQRLQAWLEARAERKWAEMKEELAKKRLLEAMEEEGLREYVDGETGAGCRIVEVEKPPVYDVARLQKYDPALWERCLELAIVTIDPRLAEAQMRAGQIAGLERYRMPGGTYEKLVYTGGASHGR